jgi:hypothetical protein
MVQQSEACHSFNGQGTDGSRPAAAGLLSGHFVALLLNAECISTEEKSPMSERALAVADGVATSKPQHGLRGLKHWRNDRRAGFRVAMISLLFSMRIAITSGGRPSAAPSQRSSPASTCR